MNLVWTQISSIDKSLSELSIHFQHQNKQAQFQLEKINEISKENEIIDKKLDEYINKGRGAATILLFLGSFAQIVMVSLIAFVFNNVNNNENAIILIKQQIQDLQEQEQQLVKKIESITEIKTKK